MLKNIGKIFTVYRKRPKCKCASWGWELVEIFLSFKRYQVLLCLNNYSSVFKRIVESTAYGNIVHIKLDMPFPFSSRDYIVEYKEESTGNSIYYNWVNTTKLDIPVDKNYVRLINAEGQWQLVEEGNNTYVYYRWNGELRGDFPNWALTRAWKEQGGEVLLWLEESLENNK